MITASVVIPAKNEAEALDDVLPRLMRVPGVGEVLVVDDGSEDATGDIASRHGARIVRHKVSLGNGAAIKAGARAAGYDYIVFMDGDGQHRPEEIPHLLDYMENHQSEMVVGARSGAGQASVPRKWANSFYNWFASLVSGRRIEDLTSGFRLVQKGVFSNYLYLLPNGFSYPTTSTMAFCRAGYDVGFVPINVQQRTGKSNIRLFRDGLRFLLIIFKVGTLYSPLKVFFPLAVLHFVLGLARYTYTYIEMGTFTNMSALLLVTSVQIFVVGLVSEQITTLMYKD
jgi:glycosyltransferase involved in cell wall biosynthesis